MGEKTNISWCDSTVNFWWGCTAVGPACDSCYAEVFDRRIGGAHWGPGVPRRKIKGAAALTRKLNGEADWFYRRHGRKRIVFINSMSDIADNEIDLEWRAEACSVMRECCDLNLILLTKRIGNVEKLFPEQWLESWPQHVGLMATIVSQEEFDRDAPKLVRARRKFNIPWTGLSMEPLLGPVDVTPLAGEIDLFIVGGESGPKFRALDFAAARAIRDACDDFGAAFHFKQVSGLHPSDAQIPLDLQVREFPRQLS